jgi:hypothetical protein
MLVTRIPYRVLAIRIRVCGTVNSEEGTSRYSDAVETRELEAVPRAVRRKAGEFKAVCAVLVAVNKCTSIIVAIALRVFVGWASGGGKEGSCDGE